MLDFLSFLIPSGLDGWVALILVISSFFTSGITAALSLGGGITLIAILTFFLPAAIAVPVHGVAQLGSNAGRAFLRRKDIQWQYAIWFAIGGIPGAILGGQVAVWMPDRLFTLLIAGFLLYSVWGPKPSSKNRQPIALFAFGGFAAFISMIIGVSGPIVAGLLKFIDERKPYVATHAILMTFQNISKILVFIFLGFAFYDYAFLLVAMVGAGFAGTAVGGMLLDRLPEKMFRQAFKIAMTFIAIILIYRSI
ncbi:sulfite exporter TauE/SafE family protein [Maritalea sp.]|uniref:sulfite exporter TauE/SafE family protein n=1 Tax=Maritalea sp. TaxID=2003361 RepID=UPI003EF232FE